MHDDKTVILLRPLYLHECSNHIHHTIMPSQMFYIHTYTRDCDRKTRFVGLASGSCMTRPVRRSGGLVLVHIYIHTDIALNVKRLPFLTLVYSLQTSDFRGARQQRNGNCNIDPLIRPFLLSSSLSFILDKNSIKASQALIQSRTGLESFRDLCKQVKL